MKGWQRYVPPAALVWLALAVGLFGIGGIEIELQDPRRGAPPTAQLAPDLWLPTFSFSGSTVIDVGSTNDMRALTFGLLDARTAESGDASGTPPSGATQPAGEGDSDGATVIYQREAWTLSLAWFALFFALLEWTLGYALRNSEEKLTRPLIRALGVFLVFWSFYGHEPFWDFLLSAIFPDSPQVIYPAGTVVQLTAQHLELVIFSSIITILLGLTLGIAVTRQDFREFLPLVTDIVNAGQTVPTLAIIAIMAPIIGFGFWPAVIALILYGLLPVVRNTIAGLESIDPAMIDSAKGMGMTPSQILWQIEIPNASSIILAGIRTSVVINVGTAALGAYVGAGGLGNPIASGLNQSIDPFVLLGALPAALLAILIDYVLGRVEFVLTPKGLQIEG
ncbi:MAG: ABC transporter permease [Trueperaceae bacterium]|nr:ABC transporter permease [Trueperaceae bacterium]